MIISKLGQESLVYVFNHSSEFIHNSFFFSFFLQESVGKAYLSVKD